ncbi:MAG: hypothetical protein ABI539_08025 [Acidobacteriota bacterium]
MSLFATIERDAPAAVKQGTLTRLANEYREKLKLDPQKGLAVLIYGYMTDAAASDAVKEDIERSLMGRSMGSISQDLVNLGIPIHTLYFGELVFAGARARKIDLFLEQQGEKSHEIPGNPPISGRNLPTVKISKPVRDAELSVSNSRQLVLEVTGYKIESGRRTLIPELAFKSNTGISPVAISKQFQAELTLWKPKLEAALKKIGQEGLADKIEFSVKIVGGATMSKEFAHQISTEIAASISATLTLNVEIPGIRKELPIELSYSYGAGYKDGSVAEKGTGMIKVTLFKFKSW